VALPPKEKVIKRRLKKKDQARRGERAGAGAAGDVGAATAEDTSPKTKSAVPEALKEGSHSAAADVVTTASDGTPLGVGEGKAEAVAAPGGEANLGA